MDINILQAFLVIAEEHHFTRAAERLQMAQPHLTRTMRRLEQELGFGLFDRSNNRHFALTPAGRHFLEEITPALAQYERALRGARRIAQGEPGKLVLGYTTAAVFSVLPSILQAYQQRNENEIIARDLSTTPYQPVMQALREGRLDVVLFPALEEEIKGVAHVCVATSPLCVVLPVNHPLTHLESVPFAALAQETWIATPRPLLPHITAAFQSLCRQAGFQPRFGQTASQAHTVVSLVAAQAGISIITRWAERHIQQPGVVYRPLADVSSHIELHLLWRKDDSSSLVHTFLQIACEASTKHMDGASTSPETRG